jgi:hypothetical protein
MIFLQVRVCVFTTFYLYAGADGRRRPRARGPTTRTCGETRRTFGSPRTPSCPPKRCTLNGGRTRASTHARLLLAGRAFTRPGPGGGRPALLLLPLIRACEVKDACVAAFPLLPPLLRLTPTMDSHIAQPFPSLHFTWPITDLLFTTKQLKWL